MTQPQDKKAKIDLACQTATDFTKRYYEGLDRRRHVMSKFYMDTAGLVWNGNGTSGKEEIQKFLSELPACDHVVQTLDSQYILDSTVGNKLAFVIQVRGTVKYQDKTPRQFQQNFVITNEEDKWKIVSDCFRFQEPLPS